VIDVLLFRVTTDAGIVPKSTVGRGLALLVAVKLAPVMVTESELSPPLFGLTAVTKGVLDAATVSVNGWDVNNPFSSIESISNA
jgi:hypothetical protein